MKKLYAFLLIPLLLEINNKKIDIRPTLYSISFQAIYFSTVTLEDEKYIDEKIFERFVLEAINIELDQYKISTYNICFDYKYIDEHPYQVKISVDFVYKQSLDYQFLTIKLK